MLSRLIVGNKPRRPGGGPRRGGRSRRRALYAFVALITRRDLWMAASFLSESLARSFLLSFAALSTALLIPRKSCFTTVRFPALGFFEKPLVTVTAACRCAPVASTSIVVAFATPEYL